MVQFNNTPRWNQQLETARGILKPGETMTVNKLSVEQEVPENFSRSLLSLPKEASAVYREQKRENTLQIREYDEHYEIQMDAHHPLANPLGHVIQDAPQVGLGIAAAGVLYLASN